MNPSIKRVLQIDLSQRNERDELLLAKGSPRRNLAVLGLRYGDTIIVEDSDLRVQARVLGRDKGVVAVLDWDTVEYK